MDGVRERLKTIREHWSLSARKLSLELGLNASAWAGYEAGESLPGAVTLAALSQREISLHWLLTGEGRMLRDKIPQDLPGLVGQLEQQQNSTLGLGRMALLAGKSNFKLRLDLLDRLVAAQPRAFTLDELQQDLAQPGDSIAVALTELIDAGIVAVSEGSPERYVVKQLSVVAMGSSSSDESQLGISAVKFIVTEVLPNVHRKQGSAILLEAVAHVDEGKLLLDELKEFLKTRAAARHSNDGDVVRLVIAADVTGRGAGNVDR